jgi:LysM repeat protein
MDKSKKRWLIILGVGLLIGLILIGVFLGMLSRRGKALNSRPLVLIIDPDYGDEIQVGDGVIVHATAREDVGLARIELWINDELIDSRDADVKEGPAPTNLTLVSTWLPTFEGEQQIIVRAISVDGVAGQSMVQLSVGAADELTHLVTEGETLESIAEDYGSSAEELSDLNPGLGGADPAPGDEIIIPEDDPGSGGAPGSGEDSDGEPPEAEGEEPLLSLGFQLFDFSATDDENVTLRLEVPGLRTWENFDNLHCYVSLADSLPQWYPDLDNNQATDDSFEAGVNGWWVTDGILVGSAAPIISWPANQPLPLSVACVGVSGGTQALELGVIALEIPNDEWDGIRHGYESDGEGGHLFMDIQVTQLTGNPRYTPKYPDPLMTRPTNVRLNPENHTLDWDFEAAEDEEISGFRIYLNGNLQWTVPADARSTRLPPEWFRPPCAWTYTFGVTAYLINFPDGPESDPPSTVDLEQPREECMRIMRVSFLELETFDLGDDGRYEDRHGDVGPAYGTFYANDASVSFDHGHEGRGLDMPEGLQHNNTYNLAELSGDVAWHFDGSNSIIAEVPFEGEMWLGYLIMDRDNNPDDQICQGVYLPIDLDGYHRDSIPSENGRCLVTFEFEPTEDSPVGDRAVGREPLPWIDLASYFLDESTGTAEISVQNTGTAAWADRDLMIEMQTRDGRSLGIAVFENVYLATGEIMELDHPIFELQPPYDACVVIDPLDEVLEYYESSGALVHNPICPKLPDLIVEDAYFASETGNSFYIDVKNRGEGPIATRALEIEIKDAQNQLLVDPFIVTGFTMGQGRSLRIQVPAISVDRIQLRGGYSVTVNPRASFVESNFENNTLQISEGTEIVLDWFSAVAPYHLRDEVEFHIDAYILQGRTRIDQVVNLDLNQEINWNSWFESGGWTSFQFNDDSRISEPFMIVGGEELEVVITIHHPGTLWESLAATQIYRGPSWGAGGQNPLTDRCTFWIMRDDQGEHNFTWFNDGSEWNLRYDLCRRDYE